MNIEHRIVVRHMDNDTFRSGCVTADLDICRDSYDACLTDTIADMRAHGEYRANDSHTVEFIPRDLGAQL